MQAKAARVDVIKTHVISTGATDSFICPLRSGETPVFRLLISNWQAPYVISENIKDDEIRQTLMF